MAPTCCLNLKAQLEAFNGHRYSDREFAKKILNHLGQGLLSSTRPRRCATASASTEGRRHLGLRPVL